MDEKRTILRHTLATVAYRGAKAVRDAPPGFADFRAGGSARTAAKILAHIGDLFDWALALAKGTQVWHDSSPLPWDREVARFFDTLAALDAYIADEEHRGFSAEKLFQGPISDALTHIGQIAILRRQADSPVRSEVFAKADIAPGRVGSEQPTNKLEFDSPPVAPAT